MSEKTESILTAVVFSTIAFTYLGLAITLSLGGV